MTCQSSGQQLISVKLVQYVSDDVIAFYALLTNRVFYAGDDVLRMLVNCYIGFSNLSRNVLATLSK